jgi:hypothetical protein
MLRASAQYGAGHTLTEIPTVEAEGHRDSTVPTRHSRFHDRPAVRHQPPSRLETAYHRADKAIQQIVDLLAA